MRMPIAESLAICNRMANKGYNPFIAIQIALAGKARETWGESLLLNYIIEIHNGNSLLSSNFLALLDRSLFVHITQQANLGQMSYSITRQSG